MTKLEDIKLGDIFYYDQINLVTNKTITFKCRVLFVGTDWLYYDSWWDVIEEWTFVPVKKNMTFYSFTLKQFNKLTFEGFEPIDKKSIDKLFLSSPEIILDMDKDELEAHVSDNSIIETFTSKIAFLPKGPKSGVLKPVYFESEKITVGTLIKQILENQNLDFISSDRIKVSRVGLSGGFPSYIIRT